MEAIASGSLVVLGVFSFFKMALRSSSTPRNLLRIILVGVFTIIMGAQLYHALTGNWPINPSL
jgi:hypothetical protein